MKVIGWHLVRLVAEAQRDLVGASIEQIRRHRGKQRLAFVLGSPRGKRHLIVGVRGAAAGFFWTSDRAQITDWREYENTEAFNRLRHARLIAAQLARADRVIRLAFSRAAGEGETDRRFDLVLAWVGSTANVTLLDPGDNSILEQWHRDADAKSKYAKAALSLPDPPPLLDWRLTTFPDYRRARIQQLQWSGDEYVRRCFWGIDRAVTGEMVASLSASHELTSVRAHWREFQAFLGAVRQMTRIDEGLAVSDDSRDLGDISLARDNVERTQFSSLAELLCAFDSRVGEESSSTAEIERIVKALEVERGKLARRLSSIEKTMAEAPRAEEYKLYADLLGANRHLLRRGMTEVTVPDLSGSGTLSIPLAQARSPQQNIEDYYRRSRKMADAVEAAMRERPSLTTERDRLVDLQSALKSDSPDPEMLDAAKERLGIKDNALATAKRKGKPAPRLPYREFVVGNHRLWVGKSSRDNDVLTLRHARPDDIFLHAQGTPGSHVILRRAEGEKEVDRQTLMTAAQVAAFFSKSKHSGLVPVVYTEARYVRKPRKAPAGTVTLEREKTVMVRPLPPPGYHEGGSDTA